MTAEGSTSIRDGPSFPWVKAPHFQKGSKTIHGRSSRKTYRGSQGRPTVGFFCPSPKVYPEALRSSVAKDGVCTKERGYLPRHRIALHLVLLHKTKREGNQGKGKTGKRLDRTAEVSISLRDDASSSHTQIFTAIILMR